MAALIKKNELERYLRSHKCNKTYILHIVRILKIKHVYEDYTFKMKGNEDEKELHEKATC